MKTKSRCSEVFPLHGRNVYGNLILQKRNSNFSEKDISKFLPAKVDTKCLHSEHMKTDTKKVPKRSNCSNVENALDADLKTRTSKSICKSCGSFDEVKTEGSKSLKSSIMSTIYSSLSMVKKRSIVISNRRRRKIKKLRRKCKPAVCKASSNESYFVTKPRKDFITQSKVVGNKSCAISTDKCTYGFKNTTKNITKTIRKKRKTEEKSENPAAPVSVQLHSLRSQNSKNKKENLMNRVNSTKKLKKKNTKAIQERLIQRYLDQEHALGSYVHKCSSSELGHYNNRKDKHFVHFIKRPNPEKVLEEKVFEVNNDLPGVSPKNYVTNDDTLLYMNNILQKDLRYPCHYSGCQLNENQNFPKQNLFQLFHDESNQSSFSETSDASSSAIPSTFILLDRVTTSTGTETYQITRTEKVSSELHRSLLRPRREIMQLSSKKSMTSKNRSPKLTCSRRFTQANTKRRSKLLKKKSVAQNSIPTEDSALFRNNKTKIMLKSENISNLIDGGAYKYLIPYIEQSTTSNINYQRSKELKKDESFDTPHELPERNSTSKPVQTDLDRTIRLLFFGSLSEDNDSVCVNKGFQAVTDLEQNLVEEVLPDTTVLEARPDVLTSSGAFGADKVADNKTVIR
ncbi:uncharacterized protein LOC119662344 [Teleopsis dalmanni]|uniref:uncharacterized protein LOC119662344 n=1 Tax=Teleopsis dalmanni TaxID=139649 RepID=UPI0018CD06E2|nr:uncharacterized protein LOC119662344 [Teleopsis dalmanni]XP_037927873.1 uncharacterized protein LOC119662344 [Teleopsis dalmanni]